MGIPEINVMSHVFDWLVADREGGAGSKDATSYASDVNKLQAS